MLPAVLHRFCRDAHLLARAGLPAGPIDGREWERVVAAGLKDPELSVRQAAGTLGAFGRPSRSGVRHELDGIGLGPEVGIWIEAKARKELHKSDVACFAFKVQDLYRQAAADDPRGTARRRWWPTLVSSEPTNEAVRRSSLSLGVILCEPGLLPLPSLLHLASRNEHDLDVSDLEWSELVRLGELATRPVQERLLIDAERRTLSQPLDDLSPTDLGDLLHVMTEITAAVRDLEDQRGDGKVARHTAMLASRVFTPTLRW